MPARKPLGAYRRTTGDWFQHQRANASGLLNLTLGELAAIGLFNSDQQGRICHILGVNVSVFVLAQAQPQAFVSGDYYTTLGAPISGGDTFENFATKPFFDLDPAPNVTIQAGYTDGTLDDVSRLIPLTFVPFTIVPPAGSPWLTARAVFYPEGGVAAFKPGRGFCIYWFSGAPPIWTVTFDFVMLPD